MHQQTQDMPIYSSSTSVAAVPRRRWPILLSGAPFIKRFPRDYFYENPLCHFQKINKRTNSPKSMRGKDRHWWRCKINIILFPCFYLAWHFVTVSSSLSISLHFSSWDMINCKALVCFRGWVACMIYDDLGACSIFRLGEKYF